MRGVSLLFPKSEDIIFYKKLNTQSKEAIWVAFKQYVLEMYHLCRTQRLFVLRRIFMLIGTHLQK
jgi:hypothetical protein